MCVFPAGRRTGGREDGGGKLFPQFRPLRYNAFDSGTTCVRGRFTSLSACVCLGGAWPALLPDPGLLSPPHCTPFPPRPRMVLLRRASAALTAAVAALGSALFLALSLFYRRRMWSPHAEYRAIKEEEEEPGKRQVLVLGLDGAGKSSMLQGLAPGQRAKTGWCRPTRGFNFMSLSWTLEQILEGKADLGFPDMACCLPYVAVRSGAVGNPGSLFCCAVGGGEDLRGYWRDYLTRAHVLVFVEKRTLGSLIWPPLCGVGGGEDLRGYWRDYLTRAHVLVFVVDSADQNRLPAAREELHRLMGAEPQLPVVVLGNKQVPPRDPVWGPNLTPQDPVWGPIQTPPRPGLGTPKGPSLGTPKTRSGTPKGSDPPKTRSGDPKGTQSGDPQDPVWDPKGIRSGDLIDPPRPGLGT
ncbi:unnamed protein product [Menidia menidia]|uniref:(Atlantic silverside) hypothetical protein n=1 Tax=Menidia menidia TaxID=238744 RepID=A0A8S4BDI4_9TELE|nr:unnamed protein product [Menidia menidia]